MLPLENEQLPIVDNDMRLYLLLFNYVYENL